MKKITLIVSIVTLASCAKKLENKHVESTPNIVDELYLNIAAKQDSLLYYKKLSDSLIEEKNK